MTPDQTEQPTPSGPLDGSTSEFQREFQKAVEDWAAATKGKNTEAAQAAAMQVLMLAAQEAERNPTPSLQLHQEADELEEQGKWAAAEDVRRRILSMAETEGHPGLIAKAQVDLSHHLRARGRMQEALDYVVAATESARRSDISTLLAMMLDARAWCLLEMNRAEEALPLLGEALSLTDPDVGDSMRARYWAGRARAYALLGDEAKAEEDLAACAEIVDAMVVGGFPGQILIKCRWLEGTAELAARRQDFAKAREAIERALTWWEQLEDVTGQVARARLLPKLADYCRRCGDEKRAGNAQAEQATLRLQLGLEPR